MKIGKFTFGKFAFAYLIIGALMLGSFTWMHARGYRLLTSFSSKTWVYHPGVVIVRHK
ncbi:MAG: hypothetical protein AB8F95_01290 [Bacteroidia bacterium]